MAQANSREESASRGDRVRVEHLTRMRGAISLVVPAIERLSIFPARNRCWLVEDSDLDPVVKSEG